MGENPLDDAIRRHAAAALAGDPSATDAVIEHIKQLAAPVVQRRLQNEEDREDAIQDLLADLDGLVEQFVRKPERSPTAIIKLAARNKSINIARRKSRHPVVPFGCLNLDELASCRPSQADIEFADVTARIRQRLSPREWWVFSLLWQGHRPGEIAALIEVHPGRISHTIAAIREKIRDIWPGDNG